MSLWIEAASDAIQRGEYKEAIASLKTLQNKQTLTNAESSQLSMLMITALMGLGDDKQAIKYCRLLTKCEDKELRQNAKDLLAILEAPSLPRPANWSIKIPDLNSEEIKDKYPSKSYRHLSKSQDNIQPPTGPTRDLGIGFSLLVLAVLIGLTFLLSGCVRITTEINLPTPNRVNFRWYIDSQRDRPTNWQFALEESLNKLSNKLQSIDRSKGTQIITSKTQNPTDSKLFLNEIITLAGKTAGITINPTELTLKEQNRIIGIQQELDLKIDLRELPNYPKLELLLVVNPKFQQSIKGIEPIKRNLKPNNSRWELNPGEINYIRARYWRWSIIGLGSIILITLLIGSFILQRIRTELGFGFPQLPP